MMKKIIESLAQAVYTSVLLACLLGMLYVIMFALSGVARAILTIWINGIAALGG